MEIKNIYGAVIYTSSEASIKGAVVEAIKKGADLQGADLRSAYLRSADLQGAYLRSADLQGAYLQGADLRSADLRSAYLQGADLQGADLRSADLRSAYLLGADLRSADLQGADLRSADLQGALNTASALARIQFIPETGPFEGWKKCRNGVLVRLLIPEDAQRSHGAERKCRASHAVVLEVFGADMGISSYDAAVVYQKGCTIRARSFDTNRWNVCAPGIHFFPTRIEAEEFEL